MRICVYGAGAIGGNFATRLAASGNEVSVVARGAHLAAIRANGLTLQAGDKRSSPKCGPPTIQPISVRRMPCS